MDKKKVLREILSQLHAGVPPEKVKEKFKRFLEGVSAEDIARIEQELIREGIPREEIQKLCDVHLAVFREQLEEQKIEVAAGTPISILLEEHKILEKMLDKLKVTVERIKQATEVSSIEGDISQLKNIVDHLLEAEKHYLREENVLFPYLEKYGITEPPAIMWMEHNKLRERKKELRELIENYRDFDLQEFKEKLDEDAQAVRDLLSNHIFKENIVLFPTALRVITNEEWVSIREEFDEIGYCCFTPPRIISVTPQIARGEEKRITAEVGESKLQFETGSLSKEEVEAILNTLPVDVTFVDAEDAVRYFNKAEERIFVRTKAIIGRKVQLCHPQKSIHIVNRILDAFKKGEKDVAEFWIRKNDRLIHIRYFAVRDKNGKYLGTMEVTQDITDIKKIEGERRLLDWETQP